MSLRTLILVTGVLLVFGAPVEARAASDSPAAALSSDPTPDAAATATDEGKCTSPAVVCVGKSAIDLITGATGGVVGAGINAATGGVMGGIVEWAARGASHLIGEIASMLDKSTRPALESAWFDERYRSMIGVAIALSGLFFLLAVGEAVLRQQIATLVRALAALPTAFVLTFAAVTLVEIALSVTDWMSAQTLSTSGDDTAQALVHVRNAFVVANPADASFPLFLMSVFTAVIAIAVWVELKLRESGIYVAVDFLPITFAAIVWRPTTGWCRRLAEGLLAVILSKFVLAEAFALAVGALGQAGGGDADQGGLSAMIGGAAALLVAALTPWVLFRLIPMTQAAPGQMFNRQEVSGAVNSAPGVSTAKTATQLLLTSRFGAMAMSGSRTAAAPSLPPTAQRGGDTNDRPVAVIPDPEPRTRSAPDGTR